MTHEQAVATIVKLTTHTIKHMCELSGRSIDDVTAEILSGGPAHKRFGAYMEIAKSELSKWETNNENQYRVSDI